MKTRAIGHACLEIETRGLRIVTDPWWAGPAYTNQWYQWPPPRPDGLADRPIDYLYLSHGHEDHLHVPTLRTLRPGAIALVPEFLSGTFGAFLKDELGFAHVVELPHGQTVELRRGLRATCYVNVTDSLLVLESGGRTLIDANDALHASPPAVIDWFGRELRRRHGPIDQLYVGYAGASWSPNCVRLPGRDPRVAARAREEELSDNFLRIVDALEPRVACAFAASFVLAEPHNRWIDDLRFEVPTPDEKFRARRPGSTTRTHLLLPGDLVGPDAIVPGGQPIPTREQLAADFAEGPLRAAADRATALTPLTPDALAHLARRLDARLQAVRGRLSARLAPLSLEIRLRDNPDAALRLEIEPLRARAALGTPRAADALLELRSELLEAVLAEPWGLESIVIGYGGVAHVKDEQALARVVDALRLLGPRAGTWTGLVDGLRRDPQRMLGAIWRQRWPLGFALGTRLGLIEARARPDVALPERRDRAAA